MLCGLGWRRIATRHLIDAIEHGDPAAAERYIRLLGNPGARDRHGIPLLGRAVAKDYSNVARLLIARGADVNAVGGQLDMSPLMFAAFWGYEHLAHQLIEAGAEVNARDSTGQTALFYAVRAEEARTASLLIEHGAEIGLEDSEGHTALWLAAKRGDGVAVALLVRRIGLYSERQIAVAMEIARREGRSDIAALIEEHLTAGDHKDFGDPPEDGYYLPQVPRDADSGITNRE
jgi:ankyrin repeat protein